MKYKCILFRILGNDLPPRHKVGQTFENTKFIIKHEPFFKDLEKRWIINRIVNTDSKNRILDLLEKKKQKYIDIPFILNDYINASQDVNNFIKPETIKFYDKQSLIRHQKILYVNNVNKARNIALVEGKNEAEWIMPFDGNCFFDNKGWHDIVRSFEVDREIKFIIVPLIRILNNFQLLKLNNKNNKWEKRIKDRPFTYESEPQIVFHHTSTANFDESMRYGYLSKVELLKRIGVPGLWDKWMKIKSLMIKNRPMNYGKFHVSGYVYRLFSGNIEAELNNEKRFEFREKGINHLLKMIDKSINS